MSDTATAQASTDAGSGQAAADQGKPGADAQASLLAAAGAAEPKAGAADADAAEGAAKEGEGKEKPKPTEGVPEKYEIAMPEGMELDAAALEAATPVFKELGLSNEKANKLAAVYQQQVSKLVEAQRAAWVEQNEAWVSTMKGDAEIGGDKFDANLGTIVQAIDKVAGKEADAFKQMLNQTGAGNHPEMARFLYRVGKAVGEGSMVRGDAGAAGNALPQDVLYPSMKKGI